jgi:hypothetical protein
MAGWIRYSRKRFVYAGRISRGPYAAWAASSDGEAALADVASTIRFALFGKAWAARRRLWRQLSAAARDDVVADVVQTEANLYLSRPGALAYSDGLPREAVQLRRLVVVPQVLANGDAYGSLQTKLGAVRAFAALEGGQALRQFFVSTLVTDLAAAAARAKPSPGSPLQAGPAWLAVGVNSTFEWRAPMMNEPAWLGHFYVLELTREPITRTIRKAVAAAIARIEGQLPTLSRLQRNDMLRRARSVA